MKHNLWFRIAICVTVFEMALFAAPLLWMKVR